MRPRGGVLSSSPTMIGAVTTLVTIVAVFLAYNANSGLPFTPTYQLSAQVPNASTLVPGNEVRVGGVRVGLVENISAQSHADGSTSAKLDLKLDREIQPLPVDSTLIVRSRSALGLKYLELVPGESEQGYAQGATLPLSAARPEPVELDQVLQTFDGETRAAIQVNLTEFGNALAGRGPDLNIALARLPGVLETLEPVMENLGSPETGLERFVTAIGATAAEVAPVAERQAAAFRSLDTTFAALAGVSRPYIQDTIAETPPTLAVATERFPRIRSFLGHSEALFADLRPGVDALAEQSPVIADALETGVPVLRAAPELNRQIGPTAEALERLANDASARDGIDRLTRTNRLLGRLLRFVAPAQTVCNYGSLLLRNAQSLLSTGSGPGTWQQFTTFDLPTGENNEGSPSSGPASGDGGTRNNLHVNPYPNTAAPGQPRECEAGNEPYIVGGPFIGNVPGNQGTATEVTPTPTP